jgi:hypothetical protein
VTSYVGILPLVAAFALLARFRLRPRPPEWIVWHIMALAGVVLALGGNTPAGPLLMHLPLFGDQRLQSRNILVADLALAVLLAYWADQPFGERDQQLSAADGARRRRLETFLGILPPLGMIAVVVLGLSWGAGLLHWLGVNSAAAAVAGRLKVWLVPYALIGAGAIALVIAIRRLPPKLRSRWLGGFIVLDVVVFTLLSVVAVGPGLGSSVTAATASAATASHGGRTASATTATHGGRTASAATASHATRPASPNSSGLARAAAPRPVAAVGRPGRFAIYDPGEFGTQELPVLGSPDLNVISATPSVQGYSSIVDGRYASATGSHLATGEGQDVLSPRAIGNGILDQLGTTSLFTVPRYLITSGKRPSPAPGPAGTGDRDVAPDQRSTWYFATQLDVSKLEVPDSDARQDAATGTQIGLVRPNGPTRWFKAYAASASLLAIRLRHPVASVAMAGWAGGKPCPLGPPSIAVPGGNVFVADGQLQNALVPPRWGFAGHDGSFAVFVDHFAVRPLSVQALPGRSASGASVRRVAGPATEPTAAAVSSPHGVRVVRSVAAIPGWSATWHPRAGPAAALAVHRAGLVQAVDIPPGTGVVTWSYVPPGFRMGAALSLSAAVLVLLLALAAPGRSRFRAYWRHARSPSPHRH